MSSSHISFFPPADSSLGSRQNNPPPEHSQGLKQPDGFNGERPLDVGVPPSHPHPTAPRQRSWLGARSVFPPWTKFLHLQLNNKTFQKLEGTDQGAGNSACQSTFLLLSKLVDIRSFSFPLWLLCQSSPFLLSLLGVKT